MDLLLMLHFFIKQKRELDLVSYDGCRYFKECESCGFWAHISCQLGVGLVLEIFELLQQRIIMLELLHAAEIVKDYLHGTIVVFELGFPLRSEEPVCEVWSSIIWYFMAAIFHSSYCIHHIIFLTFNFDLNWENSREPSNRSGDVDAGIPRFSAMPLGKYRRGTSINKYAAEGMCYSRQEDVHWFCS